ncbi:MAG: NAD-dependent epimerase/dehydratase family protein, partial [Microthrixaceae bacterium]|nr:NAD-dependent epimerase/dehydratase family protein [Microthrixaceae bacterium]
FIGSRFARRFIEAGAEVTTLDNLSRPGSEWTAAGLRRDLGGEVRQIVADVRDAEAVSAAAASADVIVHLAGQTAVTRSVADPMGDFLDNGHGTINVLEAARLNGRDPVVIHASTNKVYGSLDHLVVAEDPLRYRLVDRPLGIDERQPIDCASPYACSKGAAELYVLDYARTYGLPTVVLRQSCIYGEGQLGVEDQGWLAWFVRALSDGRGLTIFGDGKQVRDLLHVDDLFRCFQSAIAHIDVAAGRAYNVGGGPKNTMSVWLELGPILEELLGRPTTPRFEPRRLGDQRVFVADITKAGTELGWSPTISTDAGLRRLVDWVRSTDLPALP